jgi:hypothetical protein
MERGSVLVATTLHLYAYTRIIDESDAIWEVDDMKVNENMIEAV